MSKPLACPQCGTVIRKHSNPFPTVDIVIYHPARGIVLIDRANPPLGKALPGGFIDEGETAEQAAIREAKEETGLDVRLQGILGVYSDPTRDPRFHTMSVTYVATTDDPEKLRAGDDAANAAFYPLTALPQKISFDHDVAVEDFLSYLDGGRQLAFCKSENY